MKYCANCGSELAASDRNCKLCNKKVSDHSSYEAGDDISNIYSAKNIAETIAGNKFFLVLIFFIIFSMAYQLFRTNDNKKPKSRKSSSIENTVTGLNVSMLFDGSQFIITNHDNYDWTNVEFELNGSTFSSGYLLRSARIRAGETYTVGALQFSKNDGTRFNPFSMKPQKLSISCKTPGGKMGFYYGSFN